MSSTAEIRRLSPDEASAAVPRLAEILMDCVANGASVSFMPDLTRADAEAFWHGVARNVAAGGCHLFIAMSDGQVWGTVSLVPADKPNQPYRADIAKMLVHSQARRQGLGSALMTAAEDHARATGRWLLCLDTGENTAAHHMYRRLGWVDVGVIPEFALNPDGSFCPTAFMYKRLR